MAGETPLERALRWEGCFNVRDLGGLATEDGRTTQLGRFVRADELVRLTADGCRALAVYGVRTIVDLRAPSEDDYGSHPFGGGHTYGDVTYQRLPIFTDGMADFWRAWRTRRTAGDGNVLLLEHCGDAFARVFAAMAEAPPGAVVFHCFAGKDRTGLVAALLLSLAGVARETIAEDYALSHRHLEVYYRAILEAVADPSRRAMHERSYYSPLNVTQPEYMLQALDYVESLHGGAAAYLEHHGVPDEQRSALVSRLLDSTGGAAAS